MIILPFAFATFVLYGLSQVHKRPMLAGAMLVLALLLCGLVGVAH